jgi:hypothetical protein
MVTGPLPAGRAWSSATRVADADPRGPAVPPMIGEGGPKRLDNDHRASAVDPGRIGMPADCSVVRCSSRVNRW